MMLLQCCSIQVPVLEPTDPPSKLDGHSEHVMSLDFHPRKGDVLCSCDSSNEMRIWNVMRQTCVHISQGGSRQVRFQPRRGDFLASASGNIINLIDVETNKITYQLKKLELWNPTDTNGTLSYDAHGGIITALAESPHTETIASASRDNWLKLWK